MGGHGIESDGGGQLPLVLGLVALAASTLVFFTGTVPAIREAEILEQVQRDHLEKLRALIEESRELGVLHRALSTDPQAVLVEIDRLGLLPDELVGPKEPRDR